MYRYASQGLGAPTTGSWSFDGGLLTSDTMGSPGEGSEVGVVCCFSTGLAGESGMECSKGNNCSRRSMAERDDVGWLTILGLERQRG